MFWRNMRPGCYVCSKLSSVLWFVIAIAAGLSYCNGFDYCRHNTACLPIANHDNDDLLLETITQGEEHLVALVAYLHRFSFVYQRGVG